MENSCCDLKGKIAFVTGGGSGIGRATCQVLSLRGATIIAADINIEGAEETVKLLKSDNDNLSLKCDVSSSESVNAAFETVLKKYKQPPTIIVNSAGIARLGSFLSIKEKDFDDVIAVNLKGTFLVLQAAAKALLKEKLPGSMINIASMLGKNGHPVLMQYSASKAGVINLNRTVANELAPHNIRVNAILPGLIETPLQDLLPAKQLEYFLNDVPMKRVGTPYEVAEVIAFLASDKSSYMTGAAIDVTGGS